MPTLVQNVNLLTRRRLANQEKRSVFRSRIDAARLNSCPLKAYVRHFYILFKLGGVWFVLVGFVCLVGFFFLKKTLLKPRDCTYS